MSLIRYRTKRNFVKTPEPKSTSKATGSRGLFVVQLHDASHLHYDFRIRIGRTLKSWAVPKGPSMKTTDKRLAVETEDHPLAYANFEGIIPEKQYGAGIVLIWDKGIFKNVTMHQDKKISLEKAYQKGHIIIDINGQKLHGRFVLQRFQIGRTTNWFLIKMKDEYANNRLDIVKKYPESIVSGYTLDEYRKKHDVVKKITTKKKITVYK